MKITLTSLLTLALAPALMADVGVYSGSATVKTTSADGSSTRVTKVMQIVDLASGESQTIALLKIGPIKRFTVAPAIASKTLAVTDSKSNKVYSVVYYVNTVPVPGGITATANVLLKGTVAQVLIKGTTKSSVAKTLAGTSSVVSTSGTDPSSGDPVAASLIVASPVLTLNAALSKTANDAGHVTVSAALNDVKASLIEKGYSEN